MVTETQLLERFVREKDSDAFRSLVERHGPMVLGVCRSVLHNAHEAEDAFQNTFLILFRSAESIRSGMALGPWLHRVAVRVANRARIQAIQQRNRERQAARPEADPSVPRYHGIPAALIRKEVEALPEHSRKPVVLCYLEGKTNEQAARLLQCPVGTVKGRLWRAREQLRERLARKGLSLCEGPLS